jgi:ABC-type transporter Mla MlaB component
MRFQSAMLRIMLHQEGRPCRLKLAGRLSGPWVGETENVWRSALCSNEEVEVDVTEVTAVDSAGCELLAAMHHAGARLVAKGVWMTTLIKEITNEQPATGIKRQRLKKNTPNEQDSQDQERN